MINFDEGPYSGMGTPTSSLGFPTLLDWTSAQGLVDHADESAPILGVDGTGAPISVDLDSDSPHVLVSASTGGGKSVLLRSITAQMLAKGSVATVLDIKRHSHFWAKGLPNVGYAETVRQIGNALVELGKIVHQRNEQAGEWLVEQRKLGRFASIEDAPVGPRIVVVFEEINATMSQLKELSKRIPGTKYDALDGLRDIAFMGRAAKVHLLAVGQFLDARTLGGDIRECFSTRILIRYSKNTWTMLAYDCGLPQAAPEQKGRGMVCRGGKARETQFLYLTDQEAASLASRAWAAVSHTVSNTLARLH